MCGCAFDNLNIVLENMVCIHLCKYSNAISIQTSVTTRYCQKHGSPVKIHICRLRSIRRYFKVNVVIRFIVVETFINIDYSSINMSIHHTFVSGQNSLEISR